MNSRQITLKRMRQEALDIVASYEATPPFYVKNKSFYWNTEKDLICERVSSYIIAKQFLNQNKKCKNKSFLVK